MENVGIIGILPYPKIGCMEGKNCMKEVCCIS
jgi:hypothetical protein